VITVPRTMGNEVNAIYIRFLEFDRTVISVDTVCYFFIRLHRRESLFVAKIAERRPYNNLKES